MRLVGSKSTPSACSDAQVALSAVREYSVRGAWPGHEEKGNGVGRRAVQLYASAARKHTRPSPQPRSNNTSASGGDSRRVSLRQRPAIAARCLVHGDQKERNAHDLRSQGAP